MKLHSNGLIVFIGTAKRSRGSQVLVKWMPVGQELVLRDDVQNGVEERVMVLGTAAATRRDVERFKATHRQSWRHGHWYARAPAVMRGLADAIRRENATWRKPGVRPAA